MEAQLDHVVLWVSDPLASVEFYEKIVGFAPVRVEEFRAGKAPFPSIRLSSTSILDLVPHRMAAVVNAIPGADGSAGHLVNHICLAPRMDDYLALRERLAAHGQEHPLLMKNSFGAQGYAPETLYFADPDGNILEARYYEPSP